MLPKFPQFVEIDIIHKPIVESITDQFEPYSDFNFTSLFCWDTDGSTEMTELNGNLVIKLPDYITGEPVYSISGINEVDKSLHELLKLTEQLELVPEIVVANIKNPTQFEISEDRDQFDYIYSLEEHSSLSGGQFKSKRNQMSRFCRALEGQILINPIDFNNKSGLEKLKNVFNKWATERTKNQAETILESKAIDRLIGTADQFNLIGLELSVENVCIGFSIVELLHKDYAVYHFQKTLMSHQGADIYLTNQASKDLLRRGCKHINWEQDLGIEGLRNAKTNYKPIKMLKKYTVKLKR